MAASSIFDDVYEDQYFYPAIQSLAKDQLIDTNKNSFSPSSQLSRAEAAALVCNIAALPYREPVMPTFFDSLKTDWHHHSIECLYQNNMFNGYQEIPGYAGPNDPVTREQFIKFVVTAFEIEYQFPETQTYLDLPPHAWSYTFVEGAASAGIITTQKALFKPDSPLTRGDAALIIDSARKL